MMKRSCSPASTAIRAAPGFGERILDDTIHDWFEETGAQGLKIILVADACYSGTMTRGLPDPRAVVALRGSPPYGLPETLTLDQLKQNAAAQLSRVTMTPEGRRKAM